VPTGITHVVLDTPGGLQGFDLARIVMFADAIVIPVCPSLFDRDAAAASHDELLALPRVASGRCRVAAVGMRIDGRTSGAQVLETWAQARKLPLAGVLRETQLYVRSLERGLTLFDLPAGQAEQDLAQWQPILAWMRPVMTPPPAGEPAVRPVRVRPGALPVPLKAAQDTLAHGGRLASLSGARPLHPVQHTGAGLPLQRKAAATAAQLMLRKTPAD
jgi:chromosome partitioning protein